MFTEKEYFVKADNLLRGSEFILHSLFYLRWKESQGSDWSLEQLDRLKKGPGKAVFASASIAEKVQLETGNIEGWDLPLLVRILVEVLSTCTGDGDKIKQEKDSLQKIVQMKKKLANNREKKIGAQTYMKIEDGARSALMRLGDTTTKALVNKLIDSTGVSSADDAKEQSQVKLKEADSQVQAGNFEKALELYNEALMVPGLLRTHQNPILDKRAKCYLLMAKRAESNVDLFLKAERDMNAILENCPTDLRALQFRAIVLLAKQKFEEAFIQLTHALNLCPEHVQARDNLDLCHIGSGKIPKDLGLPKIPTSLEERIKRFDRTLENPQSRVVCQNFYERIVKKHLPFQEWVIKGHYYSELCGVDQSCLEAAKWYMDAAEKCNPEGMLYLASLYLEGKVIKKDVPKAKRMLEEAAKIPVEMHGTTGDGVKILTGFTKFGVQYAQLYLGILHHAGTVLPPNDTEAVKWFKKAASNGSDIAAFHLGCMYWEGEGIQRNARLAELYWTFAVRLDDNKDAAYALSRYYFSEMEYSLAESMLNKAIDFGYTALLKIKDDTVKMFRKQAQERALLEEELVKFEKKAKLPISRMTFRDRMERKTHFGKSAGTHQVCPGETSKTFLKDPARIYVRKFHRLGLQENISDVAPIAIFSGMKKADRCSRLTAPFPQGPQMLKPILLEEIDPNQNLEYPRALHMTVIEDPCVVLGGLQLVAEDSNKKTIMLHVENLDPRHGLETIFEKFGFGSCIIVLYPYNKINIDMVNTLQVGHPTHVVTVGKIDNMCRYCGEKDAKLNCGKCKWARYCSKECQQSDWKKLNHKSICVPR